MKLKNLLLWLLGLAVFLSLVFIVFRLIFADRIYPGVLAAGIPLGGLTSDEAEKKLTPFISSLEERGFVFSDGQRVLTLYPAGSGSLDGAVRLVDFSAAQTAKEAYNFGHSSNWFNDFRELLSAGVFFHRQKLSYNLEEEILSLKLKEFFGSLEKSKANADLQFYAVKKPEGEVVSFSLSPEKTGQTYDYKQAQESFKQQLASGEFSDIKLSLRLDYPDIYLAEASGADKQAEELLKVAPAELLFKNPLNNKEQTFKLSTSEVAALIGLEKDGNKAIAVFSLPKIEKYLNDRLASSTSQEPAMPKFEMNKGKVAAFGAGSDGYRLNSTSSAILIKESLEKGEKKISLQIDLIKNDTPENVNDYGIKEIIGSGHSNFSGSPSNRRHNIQTGASAVGGLLVKPGEEFSLVSALGEVDAANGYLPELVIKENKTIPEYGGGLCQVGTTLFRAALYSGLPITARRNHSYRVSYYEPAGMDAAIYIPNPDVRFLNDTGHYVLIQYRIEGNDFYFDFWGQKDDRKVEVTQPTIYNIVKPAPTLIVESPDLKPGEKKCTEKAHNGADAYFDYKVTYGDGKVAEKRFTSHYVPWREVCLVGATASSTVPVASSTTATTTN